MATLRDWLTWWFVVIPVCMGLAYGLDLLLGWEWRWRDAALGVALGLIIRVWLLHWERVNRERAMADAPAAVDPATEVSPGTMMVALVMAVNARPWWAPWRPCHTDHVTLAETTLDRPLVGNVRVGLASDRFVILDDIGALLEYHGWREHFTPGATVTAVVRTQ
ncbi:hypothetical protein JAMAL_81 [Mycobacterium phage JAMaL]|uniref:Uncharacterized protein n=1 Tax=Mycobacterium phage JAMaL TaxID=1429905 RepID=V5UPG9_9CAUD|nr:hypothetical protein CH22_gp81 [Mycobacterium phage JAMaL]AHB79401.1 hypothetical protein JAMAL_81 [Mycobacterium phage JAMaL]